MAKIDQFSLNAQLEFIKERRDNGRFLVDQPFTPIKLIQELTAQLSIKEEYSVGVLYTIEWAIYLKSRGITNITLLTIKEDPELKKHCSLHGFQYIILERAKELDMKFDVVLGNPPYQDKTGMENTTTSADLASVFVKKSFELSKGIVSLIIPSDWTGPNPSVLKRFLFKDNTMKRLNFYGSKWFDVKKDTCSFIYDSNYVGPTEVVDVNDTSLFIDLDTVDLLSLHNIETEFLLRFNTTNNLGSRWLHGSMNLTEAAASAGTFDEFVCAVGKRGDPITTANIKQSTGVVGKGIHKLVVPMVGDMGKLGNVKYAQQHQVGGHSVVFLTANSPAELDSLKSYLESKVIRLLIKSIKKSTPNSKAVFTQIPDISLSQIWTDADLYKHFNLTQTEIDYVEDAIK